MRASWQLALRGLVATFFVLLFAGCGKPTGPADSRGKGVPGKSMAEQYRAGLKAAAESDAPKPAPAPPAPKMPEVKMPGALEQTCLVKVGDAMPDGGLTDLDGKPVRLRSLLGKALTVVLFWQSDNLYATQALEYLELDAAKEYGEKGVRVVGINVKDASDAARKAIEEASAKYVNLLDASGAYFAKVATDKIPRVYLLDASGKILWLDIEYSTGTRRDLKRAIEFVLDQKGEVAR